ncbi:MAG: HPr family phosphocarrier protein [Acidobacteria bacterium]|nr:MAG: HPr family phosphocarrier protein [Acidobacteriota bacterium]
MIQRAVKISNRLGLHARAASRFVHLSSTFTSRIRLRKDGREVDGKSILGILTLAAVRSSVLELICEGEDEERASGALVELIEQRFGEES